MPSGSLARTIEAMNTLFLLNDPAYGTERSYNALRLANALAKRDREEVRVFLMGDAVTCAVSGQQTPNGYYNLERMIAAAARRGTRVGLCGTCMDARGVDEQQLADGADRSSLEQLAEWTAWADKVLVF
jgi:uncharacterized protein involved in oxidation of intracellular sulfur